MEKSFELIVLLFAALATGGLIVNWIGLGLAMSRLSVSAYTLTFHKITPGEGERARVGQSDLRSGSMLICPGDVSDARLGQ